MNFKITLKLKKAPPKQTSNCIAKLHNTQGSSNKYYVVYTEPALNSRSLFNVYAHYGRIGNKASTSLLHSKVPLSDATYYAKAVIDTKMSNGYKVNNSLKVTTVGTNHYYNI